MELIEFRMPKFEETSDAAVVVEWLKQPGDTVARGEDLLEVETEKFTHAIESPLDAVVVSIAVEAGVEAEVGTVLAVLRVPGD